MPLLKDGKLVEDLWTALAEDAEPAPQGGVGGLWQLARDAETQRGLQLLVTLNKKLRGQAK